MSQVTDLNVRQSLYTWIQSSTLTSDFKPGPPDRFDPNREDTKEWVYIKLQKLSRKPNTSPACEQYDVAIKAEVKSRDQEAALGAANMSEKVTNCFAPNTRIPIYDYATSGDPQVGMLTIHESSSQEGKDRLWRTITISITGVAQSLS